MPDEQYIEPTAVYDNGSQLKQLLDASGNDIPQANELLNLYVSEHFPKAKGKLTLEEFNLLREIKLLAPDNLHLGLKYKHGAYELWMIYKCKDYSLLEKASGFITTYESRMKATVNCIWVTEERLQATAPQKFIFTL